MLCIVIFSFSKLSAIMLSFVMHSVILVNVNLAIVKAPFSSLYPRLALILKPWKTYLTGLLTTVELLAQTVSFPFYSVLMTSIYNPVKFRSLLF